MKAESVKSKWYKWQKGTEKATLVNVLLTLDGLGKKEKAKALNELMELVKSEN